MKKKIVLLPLLFLLLTLTFFIYSGKQKEAIKEPDLYSDFILPEEVGEDMAKLRITVDPRIELLTVVQQQAQYSVLMKLDFKYRDEAKEYFNTHKRHKAVKSFQKLSSMKFSYDAPPHNCIWNH